MSVVMKGNWIMAEPGGPAFKVASNYTNYLELGSAGRTDHHLQARIEDGEFVIDAVLLSPDGKEVCRIVDGFPQTTNCEREMTPYGYRFLGPDGEVLLELSVGGDRSCSLRGTVYDEDGNVVARDEGDDFLVFKGPAILGRSGESVGVVIE